MFQFEEDFSMLDRRSYFVNITCKKFYHELLNLLNIKEINKNNLTLIKYNFRVNQFWEEVAEFVNLSHENIRNIYELINTEIPFFALYEFIQCSNFTQWVDMNGLEVDYPKLKQQQQLLYNILDACNYYYGDK